jgi:hypothetical protein
MKPECQITLSNLRVSAFIRAQLALFLSVSPRLRGEFARSYRFSPFINRIRTVYPSFFDRY